MLFLKCLLATASFLALTNAFHHTEGAAQGIYLHRIDAAGNELTEYQGDPAGVSTHPRDLKHAASAKFRPRDSTPNGYSTCTAAILDAVDLSMAQNGMASWCGPSTNQFYSAVSYVSGGANAYVCAYSGRKPGTNQCDHDDALGYYGMLAGNCGGSRSGYYMIEQWGISYGYDATGACFCHC